MLLEFSDRGDRVAIRRIDRQRNVTTLARFPLE